jgi:hypothetical protein
MPIRPLTAAAALATACLAGCCVEGSIHPVTTEVSLADTPSWVRKSIVKGYDPGDIESIERTAFHSRCAESWERYRFHLEGGQTLTLDEYGQLAEWREGFRPKPAERSGNR